MSKQRSFPVIPVLLALVCGLATVPAPAPTDISARPVSPNAAPSIPTPDPLETASRAAVLNCECDKPCLCNPKDCPDGCVTLAAMQIRQPKGEAIVHRVPCYDEGCDLAKKEGKTLIVFVGHFFPAFCENCITCCEPKLPGYNSGDVVVSQFCEGKHCWLGTCHCSEFCPKFVERCKNGEFAQATQTPAQAIQTAPALLNSLPAASQSGCANGNCSPSPRGLFWRR